MSVLEFEIDEPKEPETKPVCQAKVIVLALARDHRGIRAKMLAETLHNRFPGEYRRPLVKFFHDVGWRETLLRLRKASKRWDYIAPVVVFVDKKLIGDDDDFNLFIRQRHFLVADPKKIESFKNMNLLDQLRTDPMKTYVYFDIAIDYRPVGRMIFQIDADLMPKSTKKFLELCCSQKTPLSENRGKRSRFDGSLIRRVVKDGWVRIQTIDDERVYSGGKYEKAALKHDRRGILSMNIGPRGWLSSHVVITLDQHPWMDKMYRAIGTLIDGEYVLHMLENVETTYENPNVDVVVLNNGILYSPNLLTTEGFQTSEMKEIASKFKSFKDEYKQMLSVYVHMAPCLDPVIKTSHKKSLHPSMSQLEEERLLDELEIGEMEEEMVLEEISTAAQSKTATPSSSKRELSSRAIEEKDFSNVTSESKIAVWSQAGQRVKLGRSSRSIKSLKSSRKIPGDTVVKGTPSFLTKTSAKTDYAEEQGEEQLVGEEELTDGGDEVASELSQPDIRYTYVVPKKMVDVRTGYKKFDDGRYVETYQKLAMKLPKRSDFGGGEGFQYVTPHERMPKDGETEYYELSEQAMAQMSPKLLLEWARRIDDDAEVCDIERAISELLNSVIKEDPQDLEGHKLDAVSMENFDERFKQCLLSLPTQLLHILKEALSDIAACQREQKDELLLVTGESTSKDLLLKKERGKTIKAVSDDVISGCMFSLIEFTKRMIESATELIPNMSNHDFVMGLIDDVILEKMFKFIQKKKKKDERFKKKLDYPFFRPGDPAIPYMKDLRMTHKGISYFLETDELPTPSSVSAASGKHFAEISAKRLPVVIKDV